MLFWLQYKNTPSSTMSLTSRVSYSFQSCQNEISNILSLQTHCLSRPVIWFICLFSRNIVSYLQRWKHFYQTFLSTNCTGRSSPSVSTVLTNGFTASFPSTGCRTNRFVIWKLNNNNNDNWHNKKIAIIHILLLLNYSEKNVIHWADTKSKAK